MNKTRSLVFLTAMVALVPALAGCPEEKAGAADGGKATTAHADGGAKPHADAAAPATVTPATDSGSATTATADAGASTTTAAADSGATATSGKPTGPVAKPEDMKKLKPKNPTAPAGATWSDAAPASPAESGVVGYTLKKGSDALVELKIADCRRADVIVDEKSATFDAVCVKPPTEKVLGYAALKTADGLTLRVGNMSVKVHALKDDKGKLRATPEELEKLVKESVDLEATAKL
jgi:hypothetical protein